MDFPFKIYVFSCMFSYYVFNSNNSGKYRVYSGTSNKNACWCFHRRIVSHISQSFGGSIPIRLKMGADADVDEKRWGYTMVYSELCRKPENHWD
jgi:hypothetical protein